MQPALLRRIADLATVIVVAAILFGTLSPPGTLTVVTFGFNPKVGHVALFAALGVTSALRFAVSERARRFPRSSLGVAFCGFWILAAGTELLQAPLGRDAQFSDWLLDMGGATAGFLGGSFLLRAVLHVPRAVPRRDEASVDPPRARRSRRRARAR